MVQLDNAPFTISATGLISGTYGTGVYTGQITQASPQANLFNVTLDVSYSGSPLGSIPYWSGTAFLYPADTNPKTLCMFLVTTNNAPWLITFTASN
jgi:hypothetical protein